MAKKKARDLQFGESIEAKVTGQIVEEFQTAKRNQKNSFDDFEKVIDILECERTEKDYEWLSDISIPEYASIYNTEASQWANQYFPSRDFVDVYLDGETELSKKKAFAAKSFINSMLNVRKMYHYQKYMKARSINSTYGCVYAVCSWKQRIRQKEVFEPQKVLAGYEEDGRPVYATKIVPRIEEIVEEDRFHYEVPDPRNVFTDSSYVYSVQEKEWVIIRAEMSYEQLVASSADNGYINLDELKKISVGEDTQSNKLARGQEREKDKSQLKRFDILERFGLIWAIVEERDEDGYPVKMKPAYNDRGEIDESAELVESIVTVAIYGNTSTLIRFQPTPFRTSKNVPFRPIIRGLNYIHATKDVGMSDGKYARELQVAINDTLNLSNDRVKLATMPTLKVRRHAMEDNDSIYFEPEHMMMVDNPDDITEFRISDNIQGALMQAQMLIGKMQQVSSVYPTTMGDLPRMATTTATAVQGASNQNSLRSNYKALTFEYTFLVEFYWVMLQMGYQFMHPKTAIAIMGENAQFFDPEADYHYQPVSSNIEVEYNKAQKVRNIDQIIGRLSGLVKIMPGTIFVIMKLLEMQFELLGQEQQTVVPLLRKIIEMGINKDEPQGEQIADQEPIQTSNQYGVPVGGLEQQAREGSGL